MVNDTTDTRTYHFNRCGRLWLWNDRFIGLPRAAQLHHQDFRRCPDLEYVL